MDIFSKEKRSKIMASIRSKRTKPEMLVHGLLKGRRIKHRMWPDLPGHPDVEIAPGSWSRGRMIIVFVNGCFWHGCKKHYREPRTNAQFWRSKIGRNVVRQNESVMALTMLGYEVAIAWEHELKRATLDEAIGAILRGVSRKPPKRKR